MSRIICKFHDSRIILNVVLAKWNEMNASLTRTYYFIFLVRMYKMTYKLLTLSRVSW